MTTSVDTAENSATTTETRIENSQDRSPRNGGVAKSEPTFKTSYLVWAGVATIILIAGFAWITRVRRRH